jgi:transcriptional regulator with XRE-family HTH domain
MIVPDPHDLAAPDRRELRAMRESAGLTQGEVASAVGVGLNTVWRWEQGRTEPELSDIRALLELYRAETIGQTASD